jgi:hypothetical protein
MAAQPQLVIRRKPNLFGFGTKQKRSSVKRSSMTVSSATAAAYKAGQQSGDTGNFDSWAESKGLADRGAWLKKSYERGVEAGETTQSTGRSTGQRYSDRPITAKPFKDVSYKGYRIYHQGEGFRTSADRGESEFDDVKEAKRFIDDEVKMRRNPPKALPGTFTIRQAGELWVRMIKSGATKATPAEKASLIRDIESAIPEAEHDATISYGTKVSFITATNAIKKVIRMSRRNPKKHGGAASYRAILTVHSPGHAPVENYYGPYLDRADAIAELQREIKHRRKEAARPGFKDSYKGWRWSGKVESFRENPSRITRRNSAESVRKGMVGKTVTMSSSSVWPGAKVRITRIVKEDGDLWYYGRYVSVPQDPSAVGMEVAFQEHLHSGGRAYNSRTPNPSRITRRNSAEAADYAFEKFHGKEPGEAVFVETEEHVHENLAVVGLLMEMRIDCVTGIEALLSFEDDPPYLCMTEDGQQLYIEAGAQELDLKALGFEDKRWIKDRMVIGQFSAPGADLRDKKAAKWNIGYQTEKDFDNFEQILYQHDLGEETSIDGKKTRVREEDRVRPFLEYEPRNERLYITGGKYFISLPVIGTSPGIEN